MKMRRFLLPLGILLGGVTAAPATIIGFGNLGGNNTNIETIVNGSGGLGSNAVADGNGFVVSNGTTPNIVLTWGPGTEWDIHTNNFFAPIENQTVGGGSWDNEGDIPRIAQLDYGNQAGTQGQFINFIVDDPNFAFVLNSFDFGHTAETAGTTSWTLTLKDSSLNTVWQQTVNFDGGQVFTITPNFTGEFGESYVLTFFRDSQSYNSNGRHGLDNLSFSQVAIPEPGTVALLLGAGAGLFVVSRRRK